MMLAGNMPAQEALRSSLAYDQSVEPHPNPDVSLKTKQSYMGPVQLSLGAYTGVDFEDNINLSQTIPQSDVILRAGVNVGFFWPVTPQSDISLNTGIGYDFYLKNSQYNNAETAPNSVLNWNVSIQDVTITFYDQFNYSQDVIAQPALSGVARFPIFDNTIGTRVNWSPNQLLWQAGYSHDDYISDSSAFAYLDRSSEYFFARGAWRFAENTQAGMETTYSLTSYRVATQSGNASISAGPFVEWQITHALHATLRGGPTFYLFDSAAASSQGGSVASYYFGLNLTHQLTEYIAQELSVNRNVSLALNQGGNYMEQLDASYSVSWALTQRISLSANLAYEQGNQTFQNLFFVAPGVGIALSQTENYNRYSAGPTILWKTTDKLSSTLSYNYYLRESNLTGRGYRANSLTAGLNYAF